MTGLTLLVILIVGITASAVGLKNCRGNDGKDPVEIVVIEEKKGDVAEEEKYSTAPKEKKKKSRRKKSAAKMNQQKVERKDPFSDTIPKDTRPERDQD